MSDNERIVEIADVHEHDQHKQEAIEMLKKLEGPFVLICGNRQGDLASVVSCNLVGDNQVIAGFMVGLSIAMSREAQLLKLAGVSAFFGQDIDWAREVGEKDDFKPNA